MVGRKKGRYEVKEGRKREDEKREERRRRIVKIKENTRKRKE